MSSSMYEIFHWDGNHEGKRPAKLTLSLAGSSINIDDPPPAPEVYNGELHLTSSNVFHSYINRMFKLRTLFGMFLYKKKKKYP